MAMSRDVRSYTDAKGDVKLEMVMRKRVCLCVRVRKDERV